MYFSNFSSNYAILLSIMVVIGSLPSAKAIKEVLDSNLSILIFSVKYFKSVYDSLYVFASLAFKIANTIVCGLVNDIYFYII